MDTHLNRVLFSSTFIRLAACAVLSAGFFPYGSCGNERDFHCRYYAAESYCYR